MRLHVSPIPSRTNLLVSVHIVGSFGACSQHLQMLCDVLLSIVEQLGALLKQAEALRIKNP